MLPFQYEYFDITSDFDFELQFYNCEFKRDWGLWLKYEKVEVLNYNFMELYLCEWDENGQHIEKCVQFALLPQVYELPEVLKKYLAPKE